MTLSFEALPFELSVCRLKSFDGIALSGFCFAARTADECSFVCEAGKEPASAEAVAYGWRALRVSGELDFGLVGVLAAITKALAEANIPLFAVSTYNTDYVLVRSGDFNRALEVLGNL